MRELGIGDVLDGYRVESLLARGGMASIFKAVDEETGEIVALKVPHLHYEADVVFWEQFRREEELALRLDHPGLVRARPPRREKSRVYLVLEYVPGRSLSQVVREDGPLPPMQAVAIARETCDALAYLHAQGIVHRDVKPDNVLHGPDGHVKLLDLGIAHVGTARKLALSGLSASIGTPDYMAPEQLRGRPGDQRADVYALGTTLYELVTGRLPYPGADAEARLRAKRLGDPTPPSAHVPGLAPALEVVILRAIEPDPEHRYARAVDLLADLKEPPIVAPGGQPWRREPRRHRADPRVVGALAAIVAAIALVVGAGWLSHLRGQEEAASRAAASVAP